MDVANILTALIGRAVFERYPNLRIAFRRERHRWIPYGLDRMDFEYEDQSRISRSAQAERVTGGASARPRSSTSCGHQADRGDGVRR